MNGDLGVVVQKIDSMEKNISRRLDEQKENIDKIFRKVDAHDRQITTLEVKQNGVSRLLWTMPVLISIGLVILGLVLRYG